MAISPLMQRVLDFLARTTRTAPKPPLFDDPVAKFDDPVAPFG